MIIFKAALAALQELGEAGAPHAVAVSALLAHSEAPMVRAQAALALRGNHLSNTTCLTHAANLICSIIRQVMP